MKKEIYCGPVSGPHAGIGGGLFIILMFTTVGSFMATGTFGLGIVLSGVFGNEANSPTLFVIFLLIFIVSAFALKAIWPYVIPEGKESNLKDPDNKPVWH